MSKSIFSITIKRKGDEPALDGGTVTLEGDTYGQFSEQDAAKAALGELETVGRMMLFRGEVFLASTFAGLSATVISHEA